MEYSPKDAEKLRHDLALNRQLMAQADSGIRVLMRLRNDGAAEALADGVPISRIALAAGVTKLEVRRIGCNSSDLLPLGLSAEHHVRNIQRHSTALRTAVAQKNALEGKRQALIVMSLKTRQLDLFQVASVTGMPPEHVRKVSRGVTLRGACVSD